MMAHGRTDRFARRRVPKLRGAVLRSSDDAGTVRVEPSRPDDVAVRHRFAEWLAGVRIPQPSCMIFAHRQDKLAVWTELNRANANGKHHVLSGPQIGRGPKTHAPA